MNKFLGLILAVSVGLAACGDSVPESQLGEIEAWFVQNGSSPSEALCLAEGVDENFTLSELQAADESDQSDDEDSVAYWLSGAREKCGR